MNKAVKIVSDAYSQEKIILKVLEECAELSEVLLKFLTKSEDFKPSREKIVEEAGDVIFRVAVLAEKMGLQDSITERITEKEQIMVEYLSKTT